MTQPDMYIVVVIADTGLYDSTVYVYRGLSLQILILLIQQDINMLVVIADTHLNVSTRY